MKNLQPKQLSHPDKWLEAKFLFFRDKRVNLKGWLNTETIILTGQIYCFKSASLLAALFCQTPNP